MVQRPSGGYVRVKIGFRGGRVLRALLLLRGEKHCLLGSETSPTMSARIALPRHAPRSTGWAPPEPWRARGLERPNPPYWAAGRGGTVGWQLRRSVMGAVVCGEGAPWRAPILTYPPLGRCTPTGSLHPRGAATQWWIR